MSESKGQFARITTSDLTDSSLFKLNNNLEFIYEHLLLLEDTVGLIPDAEEATRRMGEGTLWQTTRLGQVDLHTALGFNTAEFEVISGGFTIKGVDMSKAFNFDTDIFGNDVNFTVLGEAITEAMMHDDSISARTVIAGTIGTLHLTTQEIDIGYLGTNMPVRLRIRDTANNPIAWIGDDSANHGGDTNYVGAWFKRALFGGDGAMAKMRAMIDADGNMVVKSIFVFDLGGTVGWIGCNDLASPTYYGGWFKELYVGGTGPANAPLYADSSGDVYLTDGTIQITGNDTVIKINTTVGFKIETTGGDWLQMTNGILYMQDTGSSLGSTKFAKVAPEQIACVNGLWGASPKGAAMESTAGYGVVKVSDTFGNVNVALVAITDVGQTAGGLFIRNHHYPGTPIWNGYNVLGGGSGIPKWYDDTNNAWDTIARLERAQTFTAIQTFNAEINLNPQALPTPNAGDVVIDSGDSNALKWYDGASWQSAGGAGDTLPVVDTTSIVKDPTDNTKQLRFNVDGFTTSTTRVLTPPNYNATIMALEGTQTVSGAKTFTLAITSHGMYPETTDNYGIGSLALTWNNVSAKKFEIVRSASNAAYRFEMATDVQTLQLYDSGGDVMMRWTKAPNRDAFLKADLIPSGGDTYDLGSETYTWKRIYADEGYVIKEQGAAPANPGTTHGLLYHYNNQLRFKYYDGAAWQDKAVTLT